MTSKRLLLPEQSLLLKVADYFEQGHFCQGGFRDIGPRGEVQVCTATAIETLSSSNRTRRLAKLLLARYLIHCDASYAVTFEDGTLDTDEIIINWHDGKKRTGAKAAVVLRAAAAAAVLLEQHTPTAIAVP